MISLNGVEVEFKKFPNNETYFDTEKLKVKLANTIGMKYEEDGDLIKLMILKKHLDNTGVNVNQLNMYYVPYSRMDRAEGTMPFSLKYITEFINSLNFKVVKIVEPHSDVTPALLNNCQVSKSLDDMFKAVKLRINFDEENDYIYFPDVTAYKRYSHLHSKNQLIGLKKRNFETGKLTDLKIIGEVNQGAKVLMVDDLCSRGGTFVWGAEELKKLGAGSMFLLTAHCENTILDGNIFKTDLIKEVYTFDTIIDRKNESKRLILIKGEY